MSLKAVSPAEALQLQTTTIPDFVIKAVNELLAERMVSKNTIITIKQSEIVAKCGFNGDFNYDWLNFENLYRQQGWNVKYDKPGYCESYKAFFEFSKQK